MISLPTSMPLAAIDPTLVIWFIVGVVYFIAQIFEKTKGVTEGEGNEQPQRHRTPPSDAQEDLREFLEQLTGHAHHENEDEDEITLPQPVITFDPPPEPPKVSVMRIDPDPHPLPPSVDKKTIDNVYKAAEDIQDIKELKSLEDSMAEKMNRSGSTASMLVKLFNVRMPHMKYSYTPSSPIRHKTKAPSLKGRHSFAQAQLSRIILEPPKALEEKPFEV